MILFNKIHHYSHNYSQLFCEYSVDFLNTIVPEWSRGGPWMSSGGGDLSQVRTRRPGGDARQLAETRRRPSVYARVGICGNA